ncbi:hypothetical protein NLU13_4563 [Sarocladium strictum]|uniref:AB hydrolase-1 domain-containing protein n=1 Tax=Sarocladium strictum TaxID=5046 RepID=A0AA39GKH1_SARSR|nr:hypothetical protein NLU13_4563 [Sarocladium strictum]
MTIRAYVKHLFLLTVSASAVSVDLGIASKRHHINGECAQLDIPISATVAGAVYDLPRVNNDLEAGAWAIYDATRTTPHDASNIIENTTISGTWNIHAQLCIPKFRGDEDTLQIATHGVHYDSRYWDSEYKPEDHSYVEASMKAGYSILTYDRLGVGQSDHPDAYEIVQAPLELEILRQLTLMARDGRLHDLVKHAQPENQAWKKLEKPAKVVHVGHSFGSVLTTAFIATYGELTNGAIITGYVYTTFLGSSGSVAFAVEYAATGDPPYDRPSGYVVAKKSGIQNIFFAGDLETAFTPEQLDYGVSIKQPVPIGEFASAYNILLRPGDSFAAPVQFLLPEFDFYVCRGDCKGIITKDELYKSYPNATDIDLVIQPNTGHALPLHNNATAGFQLSFDFLKKHGL